VSAGACGGRPLFFFRSSTVQVNSTAPSSQPLWPPRRRTLPGFDDSFISEDLGQQMPADKASSSCISKPVGVRESTPPLVHLPAFVGFASAAPQPRKHQHHRSPKKSSFGYITAGRAGTVYATYQRIICAYSQKPSYPIGCLHFQSLSIAQTALDCVMLLSMIKAGAGSMSWQSSLVPNCGTSCSSDAAANGSTSDWIPHLDSQSSNCPNW
jgi:hypothetical protein